MGETQSPSALQASLAELIPETGRLEAAAPLAANAEPLDSRASRGRTGMLWRSGRTGLTTLGAFWTKINNDWIFNLAGLLAYNFLMALFPILLLILAGFGLVLRTLSLSAERTLELRIANALPTGTGVIIVTGLAAHLKASAGLLLLVAVVVSVVLGSRLFIVLENCFGIIFRLRGRNTLRQNAMALGMLLLYLLLVPLVFLLSVLPADFIALFDPGGRSLLGGALSEVGRLCIALLAGLLLFGLTYALVPHRPLRWRTWQQNWKGTVVAAVLLLLYEALFPLYQLRFLQPDNYGSVAAFAVVILLFFYFLAVIMLLGAEINSWAAGQRETATDLPGILHAVQAHRTLRGAAGPTAGQPQEELQPHTRSRMTRYLNAAIRRVRRGYPSPLKLSRYRALAGRLRHRDADGPPH
jgi:YihY family inner membrane protein